MRLLIKISYLTTLLIMTISSCKLYSEEVKIEKIEIKNTRAYAYHIGDSLTRSVHLQLKKPYKLDTDLLPKYKRMGRWLLVTKVDHKVTELETSTQYDIFLQYQIINIIPALKELALPRHFLSYYNSADNSEKPNNLEIPLTLVGVSAITNPNNEDIQTDVKPSLIDQTNDGLLLYTGLLILTLSGLAFLLWGSPFSNKEKPFSDTLNSLKKMSQQNWNDAQKEKALKLIHRAFNRTANKTVFTEHTEDFFTNQKHFLPLRDEIELFFTESKSYFFKSSDDQLSSTKSSTLDELIHFVKSCQKIEHGQF